MSFLLEELPYQKMAIEAVVGVFDGQQRNFFHNPFQGDVQPNILTLLAKLPTANAAPSPGTKPSKTDRQNMKQAAL